MINEDKDIRWQQRFSNYRKALRQLSEFIDKPELNKLEEQGIVKAFEYTYELAWNTLKDLLQYQGEQNILGSRDAIRKAFAAGLIEDGHTWMDMLESRNRTSHTYDEATASEIVRQVKTSYFPRFIELKDKLLQYINQ